MSAGDERKELSTVAQTMVKASYPSASLAPWMSVIDKKTNLCIVVLETMKNMGDTVSQSYIQVDQFKKDKRQYDSLGYYEREYFDEQEQKWRIKQIREKPREPFIKPALEMFNDAMAAFVGSIRNNAPSNEGQGRKDVARILDAMTHGSVTEPKKRTTWDKITGKNKDIDQAP